MGAAIDRVGTAFSGNQVQSLPAEDEIGAGQGENPVFSAEAPDRVRDWGSSQAVVTTGAVYRVHRAGRGRQHQACRHQPSGRHLPPIRESRASLHLTYLEPRDP